MKLSNIATVMVHGRDELHLKFNNDDDLREAYEEITQRLERRRGDNPLAAFRAVASDHYCELKAPRPDDVWPGICFLNGTFSLAQLKRMVAIMEATQHDPR